MAACRRRPPLRTEPNSAAVRYAPRGTEPGEPQRELDALPVGPCQHERGRGVAGLLELRVPLPQRRQHARRVRLGLDPPWWRSRRSAPSPRQRFAIRIRAATQPGLPLPLIDHEAARGMNLSHRNVLTAIRNRRGHGIRPRLSSTPPRTAGRAAAQTSPTDPARRPHCAQVLIGAPQAARQRQQASGYACRFGVAAVTRRLGDM